MLRNALQHIPCTDKNKPEVWQALLELLQCSSETSSATQLKAVYCAAFRECAPPEAGHITALAQLSKVDIT